MQTHSDRRPIAGAALVLAIGVAVAAALVASLLVVGEPVTGGAAGVGRMRAPIIHLARHVVKGSPAAAASRPPR